MEPEEDIGKLIAFVGDAITFDANAYQKLLSSLTFRINELINTAPERLVNILYQLDIDETQLKKELEGKHASEVASLIAVLIIERQKQKIKTRQNFYRADDIAEEDKW